MARYAPSAVFVEKAIRECGFLRAWGFVGPATGEHSVSYRRGVLGVEVLFDDRDGRVVTIVGSSIAGRNPRASLESLYVGAGLGPAQDVRQIARSVKALDAVLASHAAALAMVLPMVEGPGGADLLLRCHGR